MQLYRVGVAGVLVWSGIVWPGVVSSQSRTLELVGVIPGAVTTVHVHDTYAFVSDGPTLRIHDIANPATPVLLGSYTFPQNIYGIDVSGSVAYAAVDFYGLGILDVSNPAAPTLLASFDIPGQALSVAVSNSTVVVANRLSGLEVIDVSDPAAPVSRGAYFVDGYAVEVVAAGRFAYVADTTSQLVVVDLSRSDEPTAASIQDTTESPAAVAVATSRSGVTIAGVMSTTSSLELFDVSSPSAPVRVGSYRVTGRPPAYGLPAGAARAGRVQLRGSLAFVTDAYAPRLVEVLDVSDPAKPSRVASYEPRGAPRDLAVAGSLVFLAVPAVDTDATGTSAPGVLILRMDASL